MKLYLDQDIPDIFCNPPHIQKILFTVFNNTRYSLNEKFSGHEPEKNIEIRGGAIERGTIRYVRLTATDQGTGIKYDTVDLLINPFFSTKHSGRGAGSGLIISHGLLKDNIGYINYKQRMGEPYNYYH